MVEIDYVHNLLACMIFKDNENDIVNRVMEEKLPGESVLKRWQEWGKQSKGIIYRLRKKLYDVVIDVEKYQKLIADYASIYPVNPKFLGRKTNTNTLLTAMALAFAPDEIVKTAFEKAEEEKIQKFFSRLIEEIYHNVKEGNDYFWVDILYVLGTRSGAYYPPNSVEYVSALKLGEPARHLYIMEEKGYTASLDFLKVKIMEYSENAYKFDTFVYQLASVVDAFSFKHAYRFKTHERLFNRQNLSTVNLSILEERGEELKRFLLKNPHLTQNYISAFYFAYRLSDENPVFYPFVKNTADRLGLQDLRENKVLATIRPEPLKSAIKPVL